MQAYHNDILVKQKLIDQLQSHYDADEIIKGIYWENGKGCAVGCSIHSSDHYLYPSILGLPVWIAKVEDVIFEGLPKHVAKEWPLRFSKSIKIGSNIDNIKIQFLIIIVESVLEKFDHKKFPECKKSIDNILSLLKINKISEQNFIAATAAYAAAADAAADAAAYAAAATAAYAAAAAAAADAAADAAYAATAAYAAAYAVYYSSKDYDKTVREETYIYFSDKLIELIENCY